MISAPSRHQQSSGNNYQLIKNYHSPRLMRILLFFLNAKYTKVFLLVGLFACLSSCDFFTKAQNSTGSKTREPEKIEPLQGTLVYDPVKGEWVKVTASTPTEKMDTIQWRLVPEALFTPIVSVPNATVGINGNNIGGIETVVSKDNYGSQIKSSYDISVLLPFVADRFDPFAPQFPRISKWALNYYSGTKMALKRLEDEGLKLNVSVLDTKADTVNVQKLLSTEPSLKGADLIVGPYGSNNIKLVAEYAKRNNITMVSPYSAVSSLSNENPNYLQVSPNLKSHCRAITYHARKKFRPEQMVVLYQDNAAKKQTAFYFQEANILYNEGRPTNRLTEYSVPDGRIPTQSELNIAQFMSSGDSIAFIIPAWSRADENFVFVTLSQISLEKDPFQYVEVYGMPQWQQYDKIDLDYFEKLNVHISSNLYVDNQDQQIRQFRRDFYDQYGIIAPYEAYLGYDVMLFSGRMLQKYGTKFQYHLDKESPQYLHTRFEFQKILNSQNNGFENVPIQQFENQYVNILRFQNYRFQKVN